MAKAGPDASLLLDILLAARDAIEFVAGLDEGRFMASRLHQNAVIRSLEIIGEAAGKVSAPTKAARPEIAWRQMAAMRHRLIHGYADVRLDLVWIVATTQLAPLIAALEAHAPDESEPEPNTS